MLLLEVKAVTSEGGGSHPLTVFNIAEMLLLLTSESSNQTYLGM
jgi:hypothetical protein